MRWVPDAGAVRWKARRLRRHAATAARSRRRAMERGDRAAAGRRQLIPVERLLPQRLVELKRRIGEDLPARARVDHGRSVGIARRRRCENAECSAASVCGDLREQGVPALSRSHGSEYLPNGDADRGVDDDVGRCDNFFKVAGDRAGDCEDFDAVADSPQASCEGLGFLFADVGFGVVLPHEQAAGHRRVVTQADLGGTASVTNSAIHDPMPPQPQMKTDLPRNALTGRRSSRRVFTSGRSSDTLHHSMGMFR